MPETADHNSGLHGKQSSLCLLVETVADYGIFTLERSGEVTTWNRGAEAITGYRADEAIGRHYLRICPKSDQREDQAQEALEKTAADGRFSEQGWRVRKDRSRFWAVVAFTALRDGAGNLLGIGGIMDDRTRERHAQDKLRASEEQFRTLVDEVEEYAIYMLDPSGRVATWNAGAEKIKGYRPVEIIGKNFAAFYPEEDVAAGKPQRNLDEAKRRGYIRVRGRRVRKDRSSFEADVVITAVHDHAGNLRGYCKVTRDITEQLRTREMEAARIVAEKASKAKDDFLAALSHELRTPLTPALAAAGFLADQATGLPQRFSKELEIIRRNIQLEARLIDDLLDLTRISRGALRLNRRRVEGNELVRNALHMVATTIAEKQLHLSTAFGSFDDDIWADPVRIQQVFWNLLNNAVKFTNAGGSIAVETGNDDDGQFRFTVTDTGVGIEPERQAQLFTRFQQVDRGPTQKFGGLGLGLAIAKHLVEVHGGILSAASRGKDQGATFVVSLPVAQNVEEHRDEIQPDRVRQKGLRILLVEDHGDTRQTLGNLLRHFGHTISIADCVQAALQAVGSEQFDAVLSDIGLPDGTGYEIIKRAKKRQSLKGIALTGFGMEEDVRRSQEAGFDYHLTKPVDFAELRSVLAELAQSK